VVVRRVPGLDVAALDVAAAVTLAVFLAAVSMVARVTQPQAVRSPPSGWRCWWCADRRWRCGGSGRCWPARWRSAPRSPTWDHRTPWLATIGGLLAVVGWLPLSALTALDDLTNAIAHLPGSAASAQLWDRFSTDDDRRVRPTRPPPIIGDIALTLLALASLPAARTMATRP